MRLEDEAGEYKTLTTIDNIQDEKHHKSNSHPNGAAIFYGFESERFALPQIEVRLIE